MSGKVIDLIDLKDPRVFLKKALEIRFSNQGRMNISEFSKVAGFASRSFIAEYLSGKKKLSMDSLNKIKVALRLPKDHAKLFSYLVWRDQPELCKEAMPSLESDIQELRKRIILHSKKTQTNARVQSLVGKRQALRVFSSLNSKEQGASVFEIVHKTNLDLKVVQTCLEYLINAGIVVFQNQKFYVLEENIDFFNFTGIELEELTKDVSNEIQKQAKDLVQNSENFVFYSAISIQKNDLVAIKNELKNAIYDILDRYQVDSGDHVEQLFVCLKN